MVNVGSESVKLLELRAKVSELTTQVQGLTEGGETLRADLGVAKGKVTALEGENSQLKIEVCFCLVSRMFGLF